MKALKSYPVRAHLLALVLLCLGPPVAAQGGEKGDVRAAAQNPISSMVSLPLKLTFDNGAANGDANIFNVNPVYPVQVGEWNLVSRALIPFIDAPGGVSGLASIPNPEPSSSSREFGLGDINYSLFFSPVKYDKLIWGVGPSITFPTATSSQLGSEKWSIGPTAVGLTQVGWGSVGLLARQLWSFAGTSSRDDVNQLLLEPFINYNLDDGWYLVTDMVITSNWSASSSNRWTVPVGGGVGKIFKIGEQSINAKAEAYYNVTSPTGSPDWTLMFQWAFLFPK